MENLNEFFLCKRKPSKEWLQKRKQTTVIFMLQSILIGLEYHIFLLTQWAYINSLVHIEYPKLVYSLSTSSYFITTILSTIIVRKLAVKNRNIWLQFLIINTLVFIGNVLYSVQKYPWLLITGRLLSGTAESLKFVMFGEISRCYIGDKLERVYTISSVLSNSGIVLAPILNLAIKNTTFHLGYLYITNLNFVGIFMAILFFIVQVLGLYFIKNCSAEYDFTEHLYKSEEVVKLFSNGSNCNGAVSNHNGSILTQLQNADETTSKSQSVNGRKPNSLNEYCVEWKNEETHLLIPRRRISKEKYCQAVNLNSCFIMIFSFLVWFTISCYDNLLPVYVLDTLQWRMSVLNVILLSIGIVTLLLIYHLNTTQLSLDKLCKLMLALFVIVICFIIISTTIFYTSKHTMSMHTIIIVILAVNCCLISVIPETFLIAATNRMLTDVSSKARNFLSKLGSLIGFMVSIYLYDSIFIFAILFAFMCLAGIVFIFIRRKSLTQAGCNTLHCYAECVTH